MDLSDQGGVPPARIGGEQRVTPLELFFDLVFVFALTQVTGFLAHHLTWIGMLQGAALLAVLWAGWEGYSWLTNAVPVEEVIPARIVIFSAMAAMFVASLVVPGAFGRYGVIFGSAYFVVQLLQVGLYALASDREPERRAIVQLRCGRGSGGRTEAVVEEDVRGVTDVLSAMVGVVVGGLGGYVLGILRTLNAAMSIFPANSAKTKSSRCWFRGFDNSRLYANASSMLLAACLPMLAIQCE